MLIRLLWSLSLVVLFAPAAFAQKTDDSGQILDAKSQDSNEVSVKSLFHNLRRDYSRKANEFARKMREAIEKTDQAKLEAERDEKLEGFVAQIAELVPQSDDVALKVEMLAWVSSSRANSLNEAAFEELMSHYVNSKELSQLIDRLIPPLERSENRLRRIIKQTTNDEVRGLATYGLFAFLNRFKNYVELPEETKKKFEPIFGSNGCEYVNRRTIGEIENECLRLIESCVADFKDVERGASTLGELAESKLFALRHLRIGKVAPDILGDDLDGVEFSLSDYRGKVVVLDFWGDW